jgi:predicted porin
VAKVVSGYVVRETEAAGKGVYAGAVAPVDTVAKVGAQHARNTETDVNATELFANYALSKRTSFYVDFVKRNGDDRKSYGIGLLHTF